MPERFLANNRQVCFRLLLFSFPVNTNTDEWKEKWRVIVIQAVIMAGGSGTRLRPLTCDLPKPMVPVLNRPVMSYTVDLLKKHGIENIAVTLAYLPGKIQDFYGSGEEMGVKFQYFVEDVPLGTAGSVMNTGDFLRGTFIVISGDALTDLDISAALEFHRQRRSMATLVLHCQAIPLEYGVVVTDKEGRITRFLEKPSWGEVFSDTVNTGIYILEPEVMEYCRKGEQADFSKDLFPRLMKDNVPMYGWVTPGYWCDIGDLRSYRQAQFDLLEGKVAVEIGGTEKSSGFWVEGSAEIAEDVEITPPVYIGGNCVLEPGIRLGPFTVINDCCQVGSGSSLKQTVVWKHTRLGTNVECRGATICSNVSLDSGARLFEDSVLGNGILAEENVTIRPGAKVWPGKIISDGTEISDNLVWGSRLGRRLFGRKDISGLFNVEVTPEFASRLGSAFAVQAGKRECIIISADNHQASALVADSLGVGILAAGSRVIRCSGLAAPVARYAVRQYRAGGGIHVRLDVHRKNRVHLEFFDSLGANIDRGRERKLEAAFNNQDYQRAAATEVEIVERSNDILRLYFAQGARELRALGPGKSGPQVVLGAESDHISFLATAYLSHIGCTVTRGGYSPAAVSARVQDVSASLGVHLSADGEGLVLVDDEGRLVDSEEYRALSTWIALQAKGSSVVLPHDAAQAIRDMAARSQAILIPAKTRPGEIMAEMRRLDHDSRVALQFTLFFDGIQAAGIIADYLVAKNTSLRGIFAQLPALHCRKTAVSCLWTEKGRVLRELANGHSPEEMELNEGVKITGEKGWALVLPDSEKPQFNIFTEGHNEEFAQELATEYSEKVRSLLNKGPKQQS